MSNVLGHAMNDIRGQAHAINVQYSTSADLEAERQRLQSCAAEHLADRCPVFTAFADSAVDEPLTDEEIIELVAATFGLSNLEAIDRIQAIDFAAAQGYLAAAA